MTLSWRHIAPNTVQAVSRIVVDRAISVSDANKCAFKVLNEYEDLDGWAIEP